MNYSTLTLTITSLTNTKPVVLFRANDCTALRETIGVSGFSSPAGFDITTVLTGPGVILPFTDLMEVNSEYSKVPSKQITTC